MGPRFTVLIINHDCAPYLAQAVDSALTQDFPRDRMEILVVDDGSSDDSAEAIRPYLDRVTWLPKPNGGAVSAFNHGFARARGEYVALLESDDYWRPNKLSRCDERLRAEPGAVMLQHWLLHVDNDGAALPGYRYPDGPLQVNIDDLMNRVLPMTPLTGAVFHRERISPFTPFPEKFFYGHDICLRLAAAVQAPLAILPEKLGCRRIHEANIFGETIYDDAGKLEKTLAFHGEMMAYQRDFLAAHGYTIKPDVMRELEIERRLMELFLARYRGRIGAALTAWWRVLALHGPRLYTLFKAPTLLGAVALPRLYLAAQKLYARSPLMALRKRLAAP